MRHRGAEMRVLACTAAQPTILEELQPGLVDGGFLVMQRPHDGDAIHSRRRPREQLAQIQTGHPRADCPERAANVYRGMGLWVKSVELARPAGEQQKDAATVIGRALEDGRRDGRGGGGAQKLAAGKRHGGTPRGHVRTIVPDGKSKSTQESAAEDHPRVRPVHVILHVAAAAVIDDQC